jgi:DNA-directed RNA polymerase subunit RPC12/RpoP
VKSYEPKYCETCGAQFLREIGARQVIDCPGCQAKGKAREFPAIRTATDDAKRIAELEEQRCRRAREEFARITGGTEEMQ